MAGAINRAPKRPADLVARYGKEEFAVILPNTNTLGAVHIADAIRQQVQQMMIPHTASAASDYVTLSLGVASAMPGQGFTAEALIAAADKALYEAKEQGRNRAIVKTWN